jgi:flagellum-specific peptidoglycan hydrolase FlgJ
MKPLPLAIGAAALALAGTGAAVVVDKATWARRTAAAISVELAQLSPAAQRLVLAHAAYESGFGTARAAVRGNNVFNITAGSAWSGETWTDVAGDEAFDSQGNSLGRIDQVWRVYGSINEAVRDYWQFLGPSANRGRYATARAALEQADLSLFAARLFAAGYFGLPVARYTAGLSATLTTTRLYV